MIAPNYKLPITNQVDLLHLSRSSVYYVGRPVPDADLELMKLIDRLHLEYPFAGARMMRDMLHLRGFKIGRRHVGDADTDYGSRGPVSQNRRVKENPEPKVYPYLMRGLTIDQPNHVWCAYITYIPMERGFVSLFSVLDCQLAACLRNVFRAR